MTLKRPVGCELSVAWCHLGDAPFFDSWLSFEKATRAQSSRWSLEAENGSGSAAAATRPRVTSMLERLSICQAHSRFG